MPYVETDELDEIDPGTEDAVGAANLVGAENAVGAANLVAGRSLYQVKVYSFYSFNFFFLFRKRPSSKPAIDR